MLAPDTISRCRATSMKTWSFLKASGVFLGHGIRATALRPPKKGEGFIHAYVFLYSDLPPVGTILTAVEISDFEAHDLESLREHNALTLRRWLERLKGCQDEALRELGKRTYRIWRLYLAGCACWFERGFISVYQALLVKSHNRASGVLRSREDWYR